jgi:hypothetical protein
MFNVLVRPLMEELKLMGVAPAAVLSSESHSTIPPAAMELARHAIALGLTRVFAAMLAGALLGVVVSALMSDRKSEKTISAAEAMEAMAG